MDEGFSDARVLAEVSLLPEKVRIASGRRAVAMAAGVVDRERPGQKLKQVLVVVTADWSVMCFDHNLKKLWEHNLQVCGCGISIKLFAVGLTGNGSIDSCYSLAE